MSRPPFRVFLLSPADASGPRAQLLRRPGSESDLARRLRDGGASLGDVFQFVSSLYFRGKLAYASAFARMPPGSTAGVHVITPCDGLRTPDTLLRSADLDRYAEVDVDAAEERYRAPLLRDLRAAAPSWDNAEIVLLGSIATGKYADVLAEVLGDRLLFPADFVGRGDMSRGGLLLRCVRGNRELDYIPVAGARRHGPRPAKLAPLA